MGKLTKKQMIFLLKGIGYKNLSKLSKDHLRVLINYDIKKIAKQFVDTGDIAMGAGLFDFIKSLVPSSASNAIKQVGMAAFRAAANAYRKSKGDPTTRQLLPGELHWGLHNFTGPGTRMDLEEVRNAKPYNDIDNCSKIHDEAYEDIKNKYQGEDRAKMIQQADQDAIDCYNRFPSEDGYKPALLGISGKLGAEKILSYINRKPTVFYGGL